MQTMFRFLVAIIWTVVGASVALAVGCAGMILAFFVVFTVSGPLTIALQAFAPPGAAETIASVGLGALLLLCIWYVAGAGAIAAVRVYGVPPRLLTALVVAAVLATWTLWVRTTLLAPPPTPDAAPTPPPPFPALLDAIPAAAVLGLWLGGRRGGGSAMEDEGEGDAEPART
jgi:hypothetical protein